MRRVSPICPPLLVAWLPLASLFAQAPASQNEIDRVRYMVEEGILPRNALDELIAAREIARDEEILKTTLYGHLTLEQLTPEQSASMLGAAERQLQRAQSQVDDAKRFIAEGVRPFTSLTPYLEELDRVRKAHDAAQGRARLFEALASMAAAEQELEARMDEAAWESRSLAERFEGDGVLQPAQIRYLETAFEREFNRPLPVSARGETMLHRSLGFDHRGRVDVGLHPDSREGSWLKRHLELLKVPYLAFRGALPGVSTGAHIHMGPPSNRIRRSD
ncbi:MAG: hypothetical protein R2762_11325 [Bryobacteraceae bacterium]